MAHNEPTMLMLSLVIAATLVQTCLEALGSTSDAAFFDYGLPFVTSILVHAIMCDLKHAACLFLIKTSQAEGSHL